MHPSIRQVVFCLALLTIAACGEGGASYALTLTPGANGTITANPAGETYESGTRVTVTAVPDSGYKLGSWTGTDDDTSVSATNTVTMNGDRTVSATFVVLPPQKVLTLNIAQDNTPGTWGVTATPPGTTYHGNSQTISYDVGTSVTLTAVDAPNWPFLGWTGDIGANNPSACSITVSMDVGRTITASIPLSADTSLCEGFGGY